jgi:tripartite-type tricarboxylate transporter receptor subunit TctC
MRRFANACRAMTIVAASLTALCAAKAQDAASFYRGKTVHFIVGVGVGGGFDAYARMIAPYLSKELGATVIVENQLGAGGLVALNRLYVTQPDGLRLMIVNGTPATLGQLMERENLRYDMMKFDHLGIIAAYPWIWLAGNKSGINSVEDALKMPGEFRWAGTSPADGPADGALITCAALQMKCRLVLGYKSSSEFILSMERGETDGTYISDSSAGTYVRGGGAKALASMARVRSPVLPDTKTIFEIMPNLNAEQQWLIDFRANLNDLGRLLVTSPGVPARRVEAHVDQP